MPITRRTVIDRIEISADGFVGVRFAKEIVEGDVVLHREWHRTGFAPDTPVDLQMAQVNEHLSAMGFGPAPDHARLKEYVALARRDATRKPPVDHTRPER